LLHASFGQGYHPACWWLQTVPPWRLEHFHNISLHYGLCRCYILRKSLSIFWALTSILFSFCRTNCDLFHFLISMQGFAIHEMKSSIVRTWNWPILFWHALAQEVKS
jgi:hypothetical protein